MTAEIPPLDDNDILLWPDNFWCFRDELGGHFLRTQYYRLIPANCLEWMHITYELVSRLEAIRKAQMTASEAVEDVAMRMDAIEKGLADLKRDLDLTGESAPSDDSR
jgi:hypothetical protein